MLMQFTYGTDGFIDLHDSGTETTVQSNSRVTFSVNLRVKYNRSRNTNQPKVHVQSIFSSSASCPHSISYASLRS